MIGLGRQIGHATDQFREAQRDTHNPSKVVCDTRRHAAEGFHSVQFHQVALIAFQCGLGVAMFIFAINARDRVGNRGGEIALCFGPGAGRADVFVTNDASHFAVNILAADQIDLSNQFARPKDDKFAGIECEEGAGGAPLFSDCAARFQCEMHQQVDGGDHWILIGKVVAFDDFGRSPLLYHQGAYSSVLPHPRLASRPEGTGKSAFQGRLSHNLYYLMTQAVRSYQADYQPRQLASGLRTSEARMLMVLENDCGLDMNGLQREVAMPMREIEQSVDILKRKGLVEDRDTGCFGLTAEGIEQTEALWTIASEQQGRVFADFSPEQIETFKRMLKQVIGSA